MRLCVSAPDAECLADAFRQLGLGKIVGKRTWGGVVVMQTFQLTDSTDLSIPTAGYFTEKTGYGLENHGVDVDVEVEFAPQHFKQGIDPQLDEAVRILQRELVAWRESLPSPVSDGHGAPDAR